MSKNTLSDSGTNLDLDLRSKKGSTVHGVAGVTEKDTYCSKSTMGDRALSLFFEPWKETTKPTYNFCTYDMNTKSNSRC
jgi:hypothetical protein